MKSKNLFLSCFLVAGIGMVSNANATNHDPNGHMQRAINKWFGTKGIYIERKKPRRYQVPIPRGIITRDIVNTQTANHQVVGDSRDSEQTIEWLEDDDMDMNTKLRLVSEFNLNMLGVMESVRITVNEELVEYKNRCLNSDPNMFILWLNGLKGVLLSTLKYIKDCEGYELTSVNYEEGDITDSELKSLVDDGNIAAYEARLLMDGMSESINNKIPYINKDIETHEKNFFKEIFDIKL